MFTSLKRTLNYCHLPLGLSMPSQLILFYTWCPIGALCSARFLAFFVQEVWHLFFRAGTLVDDAMTAIERDNSSLKGVCGDSPHSRFGHPGRSCARHPRTR
jgi:hypothetical protein